MISHIKLKFGRAVGLPAEEIELSPITIFVGPNNSGKSKVLSEIGLFAQQGRELADNVILQGASFYGMTADNADLAIDRLMDSPNEGEHLSAGEIFLASRYGRQRLGRDQLKSFVQNPSQNPQAYSSWFLRHLAPAMHVLRLNSFWVVSAAAQNSDGWTASSLTIGAS